MSTTPQNIHASDPLILQAALEYAANGWRVLPLAPRGKRPLVKGWEDKASTDPRQINEWYRQFPGMNLGVLCGATSGIVVLDVDPRNKGDDHIDAVIAHEGLELIYRVRTGSGGRHLYFRHPGGVVESKTGKFGMAPGVERKADGGHLVVAPPSVHSCGKRYKVDLDVDWLLRLNSASFVFEQIKVERVEAAITPTLAADAVLSAPPESEPEAVMEVPDSELRRAIQDDITPPDLTVTDKELFS